MTHQLVTHRTMTPRTVTPRTMTRQAAKPRTVGTSAPLSGSADAGG
ncbi:hypothetical protein [Streptomyces agglomeratus]|nr:hypothetical protein [Streptomyces agglomeratus]